MVYRPAVDRNFCFVLMPFGHPFDGYFEHVLTPAIQASGFSVLRADQIYGTRRVMRDIWHHIWRARIVIADVSGANANVNYELGLCHALGIPTIIITKRMEDVPFDYRDRRCIVYNTDEALWKEALVQKLQRTLAVIGDSEPDDELPWPYDTTALTQLAQATSTVIVEDARERMIRGVAALERVIAGAYGPTGENVSVRLGTEAMSHKKGLAIARGFQSANPIEESGIDQMRVAALEMDQRVGDGGKTAILLSFGILKAAHAATIRGAEIGKLVKAMEASVSAAIASLREQAMGPTPDSLSRVAFTSSADQEISSIVVDGVQRAGQNGVLTIEPSDDPRPSLTVLEGFRFDQGYLSESFVTNAETKECVLENCRIFMSDQRVLNMRDLLPILEQVARANEPLLFVAADVDGEALATLVTNNLRGTLSAAAVRTGRSGARARDFLRDLAVLTGGRAITQETGLSVAMADRRDLGTAEKVVITRNTTTITGGAGDKGLIAAHIKALQSETERSVNEMERAFLLERVANLAGNVAVIRIGGRSPAEAADQQYRATSAKDAVLAVVDEGYGYGGGAALLNASIAVSQLAAASESDRIANSVIASALELPLRTLAESAGMNSSQVIEERLASRDFATGFDPERKLLRDFSNDGALDPIKLLRMALEVAFSHARMILKTGAWTHRERAAAPRDRDDPFNFAPLTST
jgi:chaperonin GroEL